jgi:hypothetical protein
MPRIALDTFDQAGKPLLGLDQVAIRHELERRILAIVGEFLLHAIKLDLQRRRQDRGRMARRLGFGDAVRVARPESD